MSSPVASAGGSEQTRLQNSNYPQLLPGTALHRPPARLPNLICKLDTGVLSDDYPLNGKQIKQNQFSTKPLPGPRCRMRNARFPAARPQVATSWPPRSMAPAGALATDRFAPGRPGLAIDGQPASCFMLHSCSGLSSSAASSHSGPLQPPGRQLPNPGVQISIIST
jgi:hypothetical protein